MPGEFGPPPQLKHLKSEADNTLVIRLREAVAPILGNNVLRHFTDHSVIHSDNVTRLVDELTNSLQSSGRPLQPQELIILYSACYLHDIGLQLENAGNMAVIQQLSLKLPWQDLDDDTRRDLLRRYHHQISAEMVQASVRTVTPIIGLQLSPAYDPSRIACLCEAHNLFLETSIGRKRYEKLTEDGPNIRMGLISGLLRIADILDESRRRAVREKAKTLMLPLESQTHWWRHYYTENVTFDENERAIIIWFDFPPDCHSEYSKIVPALQVPWIETELQRHLQVFNKYGVNWSLKTRFTSKQYSDTEIMPDDVMAYMLGQLREQHIREDASRREAVFNAFKEARPHINRRLDALKKQRDKIPPAEYLLETKKIAYEMWNIGSKRSAVIALVSEYERNSQYLPTEKRVEIGTQLVEMLLEDGTLGLARGWITRLLEEARKLSSDDPLIFRCLSMVAEWFSRRCETDQAAETFNLAMEVSNNEQEITHLRAKLKEIYFLQGKLRLAGGIE